MGRLFIQSLEPIDPPIVMAFVLMIAVAVVVMQLIIDVLYAFLDPRIRYD
jgi:peptide/nickel transport system permease protein